MSKDYDKIAKIEKAISKKYGKQTIINPKSLWTPAKEKRHIESAEKFYQKSKKIKSIKRKALTHDEQVDHACPVCSAIFLTPRDQAYIVKFECCYECYIEYVEGRLSRWNSGWRPDKQRIFKKN